MAQTAHTSRGEMNLNETTLTNTTKPPNGITMDHLMDPDADVTLGFWLNGIGITVIGLMGLLGNMASIRVLSHKQMRSSVNFILIALAFSDSVLIVTSILLFGLKSYYPYNGVLKDYYYIVAPMLTDIAYPVAIIAQTISIYMTFLISLERYIAVCFPLKARSSYTQVHTKTCIYLVVLLSIIYNIPKFFEIKVIDGDDESYGKFYFVTASALRKDSLYVQIYIHWLYFIFMNLIPLSGITFFNLMIYRQVRIVNRLRIKLTNRERQDIKLTTMLFSVVIAFLSCNFLAVLTNVLETFYGTYNDRLTKLSNLLVTVNSSVNFIIYVVLVKKFRLILIRQLNSIFGGRDTTRQNVKFTRQQTISTSESDDQTTNDTV